MIVTDSFIVPGRGTLVTGENMDALINFSGSYQAQLIFPSQPEVIVEIIINPSLFELPQSSSSHKNVVFLKGILEPIPVGTNIVVYG